MSEKSSITIAIDAKPAAVWAALTVPELISGWIAEPEMKVEVLTNWQVDAPILVRGFHHAAFENKGIVLEYVVNKRLSYSHFSSVSRLADRIEHYTVLDFVLRPERNGTILTLELSNFPTETIQKHLEFYWRGTVHKIKKQVERPAC